MYEFSTADIYTMIGDATTAKNALDYIRVVPNPYYGYSSYEVNQLDNRVKITNLPRKATIKIFTVSGTEVRTLNKDNGMTSIDWDLKNNFGIPDKTKISDDAVDLIKKLVTDVDKRLGYNGAEEIKRHPFFKKTNWDKLLKVTPPFIPKVK